MLKKTSLKWKVIVEIETEELAAWTKEQIKNVVLDALVGTLTPIPIKIISIDKEREY